MSDKDRRFTRLQHDLRDGRIKLPDDRDFRREYLGEWKDDRADAMAYAATAVKRSTVAHRCALCSEELFDDRDGTPTPEDVEDVTRDHHAVCPKRPLEVGDAVLWEFPSRETWAEGRITALDLKDGKIAHATILVAKHSGGWGSGIKRLPEVGEEHKFGCLPEDEIAIRRIPRPAEAQATTRTVARCGCIVHGGMCAHEVMPAPAAPALVDGIDREQCLARWMENRMAVEGGAAAPNVMTRMQVDVARALWLQRFGAARSAELRALVAADREVERCRVRVEVQDVD